MGDASSQGGGDPAGEVAGADVELAGRPDGGQPVDDPHKLRLLGQGPD